MEPPHTYSLTGTQVSAAASYDGAGVEPQPLASLGQATSLL
jgi:hypothetical protein